MNLGEIVARALGYQRPPLSPPPAIDRQLPTQEDIRWAKLRADALIRRARDLQVDVDLEVSHQRSPSRREPQQ